MAMLRSCGVSSLTTWDPMRISPPLMSSSPAISRKSVDLPQPDGPTSATNSPAAMSTLTASSAVTAPKRLVTWSMLTLAMRLSLRAKGPVVTGNDKIGRQRPHSVERGVELRALLIRIPVRE